MYLSRLFLLVFVFVSIINLSGCKEEEAVNADTNHFEPEGWFITTTSDTLVVWEGIIQSSWSNKAVTDTIFLSLNTSKDLLIKFLDNNRNLIEFPSDDDELDFTYLANNVICSPITQNPLVMRISNNTIGTGDLEFQVLHNGHVDVRTPKIVVVTR